VTGEARNLHSTSPGADPLITVDRKTRQTHRTSEVDSIIKPAVKETVKEYKRWADMLWDGEEPDLKDVTDRMSKVILVSLMAGMSTVGDEEDVLEVDKHVDLFAPVFKESVEALAKKSPTLRIMNPHHLSDQVKQTAWYVSGVMSGNILDKIRAKLIEARVEGHSRDWFTQQVFEDAETTASHIETVFRTNAASAAGAGRWKQYNDPDVSDLIFGYRYVSQGDHRSRPLHKAMNNFVAVKDDPVWKLIWVPNGYNCRCKVRPLRKADAIKYGIISKDGNIIERRVFVNDFQRTVVAAAEGGVALEVDGNLRRFPDDGFRGNALMDLV